MENILNIRSLTSWGGQNIVWPLLWSSWGAWPGCPPGSALAMQTIFAVIWDVGWSCNVSELSICPATPLEPFKWSGNPYGNRGVEVDGNQTCAMAKNQGPRSSRSRVKCTFQDPGFPRSRVKYAFQDPGFPRSHVKYTFLDPGFPRSHVKYTFQDPGFPRSHVQYTFQDPGFPRSYIRYTFQNPGFPRSHDKDKFQYPESPRSHNLESSRFHKYAVQYEESPRSHDK